MKPILNTRLVLLYSYMSMICSVIVGIVGVSVLWGWIFDISVLKTIIPNFIAMKPKTALAFVLVSIVLILRHSNHVEQRPIVSYIIYVLCSIVVIIAIFNLLEWFKPAFQFDAFLFPSRIAELKNISPEKIQVINSLLFILIAGLLMTSNHKYYLQQYGALIITTVGLFAIIQIGYHLPFNLNSSYFEVTSNIYTSVNAAIGFFIIGISLLLLHPSKGICKILASNNQAGKVLRRVVPIFILLLIGLGYLRVIDLHVGVFDKESGLAILIMIILAVFMVIIFSAAHQLMQMEINRETLRIRFRKKERLWKKNIIAKQKELERSNQDLENFAYIASHDLEEPLRMVVNYNQLLEKKHGDELSPEAKEFLDYAISGCKRMQLLIKSLLDYSRIATRPISLSEVDCNKVVLDVISDLKSKILEKNAEITADTLPIIMADAAGIYQVFLNLVSNAIKFSEQAPKVHISVKEEPNQWVFSVVDNGIGIDEKDFNKIFVLFRRLNSQNKFPGSGIGVCISKKIIERQGGRIWFESMLGKGSKFYFSVLKDR